MMFVAACTDELQQFLQPIDFCHRAMAEGAQLIIADPWFDWLRPMAQLVLMIDERTSDKKAVLGTSEARSLLARARLLLRADSEGDAFQRLYFDAIQASPELAVLARQVALGQAETP